MDTPTYNGMCRDPWWGDPAEISHEIRMKVDPLYRLQQCIDGLIAWAINVLGDVLGIGDIMPSAGKP